MASAAKNTTTPKRNGTISKNSTPGSTYSTPETVDTNISNEKLKRLSHFYELQKHMESQDPVNLLHSLARMIYIARTFMNQQIFLLQILHSMVLKGVGTDAESLRIALERKIQQNPSNFTSREILKLNLEEYSIYLTDFVYLAEKFDTYLANNKLNLYYEPVHFRITKDEEPQEGERKIVLSKNPYFATSPSLLEMLYQTITTSKLLQDKQKSIQEVKQNAVQKSNTITLSSKQPNWTRLGVSPSDSNSEFISPPSSSELRMVSHSLREPPSRSSTVTTDPAMSPIASSPRPTQASSSSTTLAPSSAQAPSPTLASSPAQAPTGTVSSSGAQAPSPTSPKKGGKHPSRKRMLKKSTKSKQTKKTQKK